MSSAAKSTRADPTVNRLDPADRAAHDWYRFVLSFPPHLVREYLGRFGCAQGSTVLDPFCGTGTTLVECRKAGINSVGIEANPMAHLASSTKVDWRPDPGELRRHAERVASATNRQLEAEGMLDEVLPLLPSSQQCEFRQLTEQEEKLLLRGSISPRPLHKTLVLREHLMRMRDDRFLSHERLALAKALVTSIGNLKFGPEVGVGAQKPDAAVVNPWLAEVCAIADDLPALQSLPQADATVHLGDARDVGGMLPPTSVDAVFTSPPYPNEKDYTRTTRLESVLLGLIGSKADLRALKQSLVRSNTRNVYKADADDALVVGHPEIERIAADIEARRVELGKTSGFERQYARVTKLYFGGMARHLGELRRALKPGAYAAYVVGDQASYLRVMIRTGQLLADIARGLGYQIAGIDLFRTRFATATSEQLREEVVVLRWPG